MSAQIPRIARRVGLIGSPARIPLLRGLSAQFAVVTDVTDSFAGGDPHHECDAFLLELASISESTFERVAERLARHPVPSVLIVDFSATGVARALEVAKRVVCELAVLESNADMEQLKAVLLDLPAVRAPGWFLHNISQRLASLPPPACEGVLRGVIRANDEPSRTFVTATSASRRELRRAGLRSTVVLRRCWKLAQFHARLRDSGTTLWHAAPRAGFDSPRTAQYDLRSLLGMTATRFRRMTDRAAGEALSHASSM